MSLKSMVNDIKPFPKRKISLAQTVSKKSLEHSYDRGIFILEDLIGTSRFGVKKDFDLKLTERMENFHSKGYIYDFDEKTLLEATEENLRHFDERKWEILGYIGEWYKGDSIFSHRGIEPSAILIDRQEKELIQVCYKYLRFFVDRKIKNFGGASNSKSLHFKSDD